MLSEREARSLRAIERQLVAEDHRFVAFMSRPVFDRRDRWTRRGYDMVIGIALSSAVPCIALSGGETLLPGLTAVALAGLTGYVRWRRFPPRRVARSRT
ncbi:hypothetical protein GCM10023321_47880 [Pseudonocardia eucalypti]|uniref:DUF3040 domain-containing protein n=1 Tax=Pseudonocardia eucalypti TaxID=648755 RepID=A0ABP9QI72_9PSEU|nr:hypothetical protein [Pseudonocardia eucalypti]